MQYEDLGNADKMASMRTSLAFQRTRMAADRTLMAVIRTALSMIGFGFTIYNFFQAYTGRALPNGFSIPEQAPARFGLSLVVLGVLLLILGIVNHYQYMRQLRSQRADFIVLGFMPGTSIFPPSLALITAFLLVLVGMLAVLSMIFRNGPY